MCGSNQAWEQKLNLAFQRCDTPWLIYVTIIFFFLHFFYTGPCGIDLFSLNNKHVYLETAKQFFTYSLCTSLHVQAMSMHVSNGRYFYLVTEANTLL